MMTLTQLSMTCSVLLAAVSFGDSPASATDAALSVSLSDGTARVVVPPGGTCNALVSVEVGDPIHFNAALFRLAFSAEGLGVLEYGWHAPFVTGGATDFSLEGLSLPLVVTASTLEGLGYPAEAPDVEFGNFDLFLGSGGGPLVDLALRAPIDATPGAVFLVYAIPDLFTDGFDPVAVGPGAALVIQIANSSVFGDLSGDGAVNILDLSILLGNWGGSGVGDLDGDGIVKAEDVAVLLGAWTT